MSYRASDERTKGKTSPENSFFSSQKQLFYLLPLSYNVSGLDILDCFSSSFIYLLARVYLCAFYFCFFLLFAKTFLSSVLDLDEECIYITKWFRRHKKKVPFSVLGHILTIVNNLSSQRTVHTIVFINSFSLDQRID